MTFKSIDLQMSVPRTQEFSGLQSQAAHKPVADQTTLAEQASKHTDELRSKNTAIEHSTGLQVRSENEKQQGRGNKKKGQKGTAEQFVEQVADQPPTHPYKGHNFDIKL